MGIASVYVCQLQAVQLAFQLLTLGGMAGLYRLDVFLDQMLGSAANAFAYQLLASSDQRQQLLPKLRVLVFRMVRLRERGVKMPSG